MKTLPNNQRGALTATFLFSLIAILLLVFIPTSLLNYSTLLTVIAIGPLLYWIKPKRLYQSLGEPKQRIKNGWLRILLLQLGTYGLFSLVDNLFGSSTQNTASNQWNTPLFIWLMATPIVILLGHLNWVQKKPSSLGNLITANYSANHPATILFNFICNNAFLTTLAGIILLLILSIQQSITYTFFSMPPLIVLLLAAAFILLAFNIPFFKRKLHARNASTHQVVYFLLAAIIIWSTLFSNSLTPLQKIQSQTLADSIKIIMGLGLSIPVIYQATELCKGTKVYQVIMLMLALPASLAFLRNPPCLWIDILLATSLLHLCCSKRYFISTCYSSLQEKRKTRSVSRLQQGIILTLVFALTLTAFNALSLFFTYAYLRTWLTLPLLVWACIRHIRPFKK